MLEKKNHEIGIEIEFILIAFYSSLAQTCGILSREIFIYNPVVTA